MVRTAGTQEKSGVSFAGWSGRAGLQEYRAREPETGSGFLVGKRGIDDCRYVLVVIIVEADV